MTEPIFFNIPIYRCKIDTHTAEMKLDEERKVPLEYKESAPISYEGLKNHFHKTVWYPWKYNEIIGYLGLFILGSQLRADLWLAKKDRYNRGIVKKRFLYYGKALEKQLPREETSEVIFAFIKEQLLQLNKRQFKRRFFDLTTFNVIGKYVNWVELTNQLNSYKYLEILFYLRTSG